MQKKQPVSLQQPATKVLPESSTSEHCTQTFVEISTDATISLNPTNRIFTYSQMTPLLNCCGIEILNLGPDRSTFFWTLGVSILISACSIVMVLQLEGISENVKKFAIGANLAQNIAYILVGLIDPGIVLANEREESVNDELTLCHHCEVYVRFSTTHCSRCNVCVRGYDHHCPWVGKCIGRKNIVFFGLFIFATPVAMMTDIILAITSLSQIK